MPRALPGHVIYLLQRRSKMLSQGGGMTALDPLLWRTLFYHHLPFKGSPILFKSQPFHVVSNSPSLDNRKILIGCGKGLGFVIG